MSNSLKIRFLDGTVTCHKEVKEYVSGYTYFFLAYTDTITDNVLCIAYDRDTIESVERQYLDGTKPVLLKGNTPRTHS